jgi:hypothetical protein
MVEGADLKEKKDCKDGKDPKDCKNRLLAAVFRP